MLNDVVLNQVLVRFGDDDAATDAVIAARAGRAATCWLGGTRWHGAAAMRISVSGWQTTEADADRSADAIAAAWRDLNGVYPVNRAHADRRNQGARLRRGLRARRRDRPPPARRRRARDHRRRRRRPAARRSPPSSATAFAPCDVTDPAQVEAAVAAAGPELRIAVTCAGIGWAEKTAGKRGPHAVEPFHKVVAVNLLGSFHLLRAAGAAMLGNAADAAARPA